MKILTYSDSPVAETGFAQVTKPILQHLHDQGHEIISIGIGHKANIYDRTKYPYLIVGDEDMYSVNSFLNYLNNWDYDVLFTHQDFGYMINFVKIIRELKAKRKFKWVNYSPVDTDLFFEDNLEVIREADITVNYTDWGTNMLQSLCPERKDSIKTIRLPNYGDFKPLQGKHVKAKLKQDLFGLSDKIFLISNINRNHERKDPFKTLQGFQAFAQNKPDVRLYLHMQKDPAGGMDIPAMCKLLNIEDKVIYPAQFTQGMGFAREDMPKIYQASDLVVSTTKAEGWGYSCSEAFACKIPVLMHKTTALKELIGEKEERGYFIESGDWTLNYAKASYPRPTASLYDYVRKLEMIYIDWKQGYKNTQSKIDNAYKWVQEISIENTLNEWDKIIC